jgi:hypothetical protein
MLRGLPFSFLLFVGIMFCLAILAVALDNDLFSLAYTEEQQEQLISTNDSTVAHLTIIPVDLIPLFSFLNHN